MSEIGGEKSETEGLNNKEIVKFSAEVNDKLIAIYKLFQETFDPQTGIVYYPCSGSDFSPSEAFKQSRVIYVDQEDGAMDALRKDGYEAYTDSVLDFKPENYVDVLILSNPQIPPDAPAKTVKIGGYVVCNNYHSTAYDLKKNDNFQAVGILIKDFETENQFFQTEGLEPYFEEVETDDELN